MYLGIQPSALREGCSKGCLSSRSSGQRRGWEGAGFNRPNRKVSSIVFKFHLMVTSEKDGREE